MATKKNRNHSNENAGISATGAPHDTLVREHFQHPEHAVGLLRAGLPPEMFAELKPETLRHKGIHLSTTALLKSVTDLVFTCELRDGSDGYVHIVLEHKAHPDALVAVQVLKYMALIWDHYRRKNPGNTRLPFVIPLIFYHGAEHWEPRTLRGLFAQDSPLLACVPDFTMSVFDLSKASDTDLRSDVFRNAMLLLLKSVLERESAQRIAQTLHLIYTTCTDADIADVLQLFFNYLAEARPDITTSDLDAELAQLPGGGTMGQLTMGKLFQERWNEYSFNQGAIVGRQEGILLGEARGEARGVCTTVLDFLAERFTVTPVPLIEKLRTIQDAEVLRQLAVATLKVESLEEFDTLVDRTLGLDKQ